MTEATLDLGYLAAPAGGGPGLIVVHDVWGLAEHTRDLARRLAGEGFVALAVDLYRGLGAVPTEDPGAWMRALSDPDLLARLKLAVDFLRGRTDVRGRVGVVGFCMGGTYTLHAGASLEHVGAIAPFYGILSFAHGLYRGREPLDPRKKPREPLAAAPLLRCPMIAFFGAEDPYIPLEDVREFERRLLGVAFPTEVHVYEGAGHAFANDTRPQMYRPDAARDAWARMTAFLRIHLAAS